MKDLKESHKQKSAVMISASSDIGAAMSGRWLKKGWQITGTYRTKSSVTEALDAAGMKLIHCDLSGVDSIQKACSMINGQVEAWDVLVLCPATMNPIGPFLDCEFDQWEQSLNSNFTGQMRIVHELLASRNMTTENGACVLFFAGGGTNNATIDYSAYTISKIALIKMCELLDAEIPDVRFVIVGPGWVKTKIHQETITAGDKAGQAYQTTQKKFEQNEFTSMEDVLDCCDWLIRSPRRIVGGRNFSVVFDCWGDKKLEDLLIGDEHVYKLRRYGNDLLTKG